MSEIENQLNESFFDESKKEEKKSFIEQFEDEREEWTSAIRKIASQFKIVEGMAEVQVDLYSRRQQAVDYMQQLSVLQSRLKKKYETEWKKAYDDLAFDDRFSYNEREKNRFATEKISDQKLKIDIVQTHIDFFKETIKTIDNMVFGVKHRIEIENFKIGNK